MILFFYSASRESDGIHSGNDGFHRGNDEFHRGNDGFHRGNDGFGRQTVETMDSTVETMDFGGAVFFLFLGPVRGNVEFPRTAAEPYFLFYSWGRAVETLNSRITVETLKFLFLFSRRL